MKQKPSAMPQTVAAWERRIADQAGVELTTTRVILDKHRIQPHPTLPRARSLSLRSLAFEGTKSGTENDGIFRFARTGMSSGIWAFMSDENFRGKSSIIAIIHSAVTGQYPGRLKADIWKWLKVIDVRFDIDSVPYRVLVEKPAGAEKASETRVRMSRLEPAPVDLYDGHPGQELEASVAALFMEELGFAKFHAFSATAEGGHAHGWPALASALFVTDPGAAIFGDVLFDGMPLRLLQLFIGLPWISTYTAAAARLKTLGEANQKAKVSTDGLDAVRTRLATIAEELASARRRLESRPDRDSIRRGIIEQERAADELDAKLRRARNRLRDLGEGVDAAQSTLNEAKRRLQQVQDEEASGHVFRKLQPVCCPACDLAIDRKKYSEQEAQACALCGSSISEDADVQSRVDEHGKDVTDAAQVLASLMAERNTESTARAALQARYAQLQESIEAAKQALAEPNDTALELEVTSLAAKEQELSALLNQAAPATEIAKELDADEPVLKAAVAASKAMFEDLQREVLADVSQTILAHAKTLGIANLTAAQLTMNGHLKLTQGGAETSFSRLAPGERLRFRIAAALAVIQVARTRGHGRHPGLLVLDSPAAQEMAADDFAAVMASLQQASQQLAEIQIIVGAVARNELLKVVPTERAHYARGKDYLF